LGRFLLKANLSYSSISEPTTHVDSHIYKRPPNRNPSSLPFIIWRRSRIPCSFSTPSSFFLLVLDTAAAPSSAPAPSPPRSRPSFHRGPPRLRPGASPASRRPRPTALDPVLLELVKYRPIFSLVSLNDLEKIARPVLKVCALLYQGSFRWCWAGMRCCCLWPVYDTNDRYETLLLMSKVCSLSSQVTECICWTISFRTIMNDITYDVPILRFIFWLSDGLLVAIMGCMNDKSNWRSMRYIEICKEYSTYELLSWNP
jgi:hypothetical protein